MIILSDKKGMSFERIARDFPESIHTFPFRLSEGITADDVIDLGLQLGFGSGDRLVRLAETLQDLYRVFVDTDATLLESSNFALLKDGTFRPLQANMTFDDAASARQPALYGRRDVDHEVAEESDAEKYNLVYVRMDGDVGTVVNGAGLAMATNDAIREAGGASANFLDAGGQATEETMQQAFRIIMADQRVKAILVNIYGGKCSPGNGIVDV